MISCTYRYGQNFFLLNITSNIPTLKRNFGHNTHTFDPVASEIRTEPPNFALGRKHTAPIIIARAILLFVLAAVAKARHFSNRDDAARIVTTPPAFGFATRLTNVLWKSGRQCGRFFGKCPGGAWRTMAAFRPDSCAIYCDSRRDGRILLCYDRRRLCHRSCGEIRVWSSLKCHANWKRFECVVWFFMEMVEGRWFFRSWAIHGVASKWI